MAHYSGGKYSSSFSGDSPKGDSHVYDSVAHSAGIGSATYYAFETIEAHNVLSDSEYGPVVFLFSLPALWFGNVIADVYLDNG